MFWSEYHQRVMNLAIDILGMEGQILTGDPSVEEAVPRQERHRVVDAGGLDDLAVLGDDQPRLDLDVVSHG
jgi:hypothetical protein